MRTKVGGKVHPRYKRVARWEVKAIAKLTKPMEWRDEARLGQVAYDPRILWLSCSEHKKVLWFAYWISTSRTKGKLKWGQGAPMLEEDTLLQLLKDAIGQGILSSGFLKNLKREIESVAAI